MRLSTFALTLALSAGAATPTLADEITIDTWQGPAMVSTAPETVAALDISVIDTLATLGISVDGVPGNLFVDYLDEVAADAVPVGTLHEPDFEALVNLNPDLILAGGRSSRQVEALSELALTVDMTISGDDHIGQSLARLQAYGQIFGVEDRAAEVEAEFQTLLSDTRDAIAGNGNALILLTNGPRVSAYGAGSRFGWIHAALDLPEAVEGIDEQTHGEAISFEFIAEANPDWLIVVDRVAAIGSDGDGAAVTLDNALVHGTTAWQNDQVIYVNAANIYIAGGGIQSMSSILQELMAGFAGDS